MRFANDNKQQIISKLLGQDYWLKMYRPVTGNAYYVRFLNMCEDHGHNFYLVNLLDYVYFANGEYHRKPNHVKLQMRQQCYKKIPINFEIDEPLSIYTTDELLDCIANNIAP